MALAVGTEQVQHIRYDQLAAASHSLSLRIKTATADAVTDVLVSIYESPPVFGIMCDKGAGQCIGVLGTLRAGCAYLPMSPTAWPRKRVEHVLSASASAAVVTDLVTLGSKPWLLNLELPLFEAQLELCPSSIAPPFASPRTPPTREGVAMSDLAYLIYTSGSSGKPKGVCCHHRGAVNTILAINERFGIGCNDRVLAQSALSFDLSVYDIFGLLGAGGAVVLPPTASLSPPDPDPWLKLMNAERVTVWNSVPALMELTVTHLERAGRRLPQSLRVVLLSGDWIPLSLPDRIRSLSDNLSIRLVSLGGATEAAIWSNFYEIGPSLGCAWKSIPYGFALPNQSLHVLDSQMKHCEAGETGSIYIGGEGVAYGYRNDPERTAAQFVREPRTGERLFRTGDLGRLRDGVVEILGREDAQVAEAVVHLPRPYHSRPRSKFSGCALAQIQGAVQSCHGTASTYSRRKLDSVDHAGSHTAGEDQWLPSRTWRD